MQYDHLKRLFFLLDAEQAHTLAAATLGAGDALPQLLTPLATRAIVDDPALRQSLLGVDFPNPIGLAAGFDKDATMIRATAAMGFGFTEVGTVTPKAQPGNPKPRLFRHIDEESLQNAMGFNNAGSYAMLKKLKKRYPSVIPLGVNIGKNKMTPEDSAIDDYAACIKALHPWCDYMVFNLSSPNTPGLRDLQNEAFIKALFARARELTDKPLLLKIAPDMTEERAVDLCGRAAEAGARGIIAANTTIDYTLVRNPHPSGGLSGAVLREKSFALFDALAKEFYGKTLLISVGGVDSAYEAYRRIRAGASLVQLYTALIFKGPMLLQKINRGLLEYLQKEGFRSIKEAVGADRK